MKINEFIVVFLLGGLITLILADVIRHPHEPDKFPETVISDKKQTHEISENMERIIWIRHMENCPTTRVKIKGEPVAYSIDNFTVLNWNTKLYGVMTKEGLGVRFFDKDIERVFCDE